MIKGSVFVGLDKGIIGGHPNDVSVFCIGNCASEALGLDKKVSFPVYRDNTAGGAPLIGNKQVKWGESLNG